MKRFSKPAARRRRTALVKEAKVASGSAKSWTGSEASADEGAGVLRQRGVRRALPEDAFAVFERPGGECLVRSGSRGGCYRNGAGRVNPSAARKRISHTFPQFREIPLRAAHPHRAGGIGKAAASRGRSNSTVRETHTIVRSGSGDFNQNHVRWNRLRDLRAPGNDSHRVRLRLRRREQVFQRVGGGVQMETFAVP